MLEALHSETKLLRLCGRLLVLFCYQPILFSGVCLTRMGCNYWIGLRCLFVALHTCAPHCLAQTIGVSDRVSMYVVIHLLYQEQIAKPWLPHRQKQVAEMHGLITSPIQKNCESSTCNGFNVTYSKHLNVYRKHVIF